MARTPSPPTPQTKKHRIVVADDDSQVRKLFAKKLLAEGYEVIEARSGEEAITCLRASACDLLVLDLSMPNMDGFDVLRTLRAEMPDMRVVAVSGYMDGAFLEAASFLGAMETLDKPTTPQVLAQTVRNLLAES